MEVAAPCTICKQLTPCQCKRTLVTYFNLLDKIQKRVLSAKAASNLPHSSVFNTGIDKLDARFQAPIEIAEILEKAQFAGCEYKILTLRNRRPYLLISKEGLQLHFTLDFQRSCITGLTSNPNRFESWTTYLKFLENLLTPPVIRSANIQRLDLNIDFTLSFSDLIQQIDVRNKSTAVSFDEKGGQRTGLNIGRKPELIVIYNKSEKNKGTLPQTRIELRLNRPKLKIDSIYTLPEQLRNQNYFHNLLGRHLSFTEQGLSETQNQRLQEFQSFLSRDGLFSTRKHMNKYRNFDRDFAKILKIKDWCLSPSELFKQGIERFLGAPHTNLKLAH